MADVQDDGQDEGALGTGAADDATGTTGADQGGDDASSLGESTLDLNDDDRLSDADADLADGAGAGDGAVSSDEASDAGSDAQAAPDADSASDAGAGEDETSRS